MSAERWFRNGLRFACTQCGHCCTTEGYVWVGRREAQQIASYLELTLEEFGRRYLRTVDGRWALVDRSDGACVFWDEGCQVYEARPSQCRTFPFWKENLTSEGTWEETAAQCEGIGDGRLYPLGEIEGMLAGRGETAPGAVRGSADEPEET